MATSECRAEQGCDAEAREDRDLLCNHCENEGCGGSHYFRGIF